MIVTDLKIRNMTIEDREEVASVVFHSLNAYYISIGRGPLLQGEPLSAAIFFDVYWKIDPEEGIVAVDNNTNQIVASCFVHPRETHYSLGIMNVHPDHFGRGLARSLLMAIIDKATLDCKPVRLVSSCSNLDSYSLYTRAGFVPFITFQDMILEVPATGLTHPMPDNVSTRKATPEDAEAMAAIELELTGISRLEDYRYFLRNEEGFWSVSVVEDRNGGLDGYLVSCKSQDFNTIGPGVSRRENQAVALLHAQLNEFKGRTPLFLVPVNCAELVSQAYKWGARNCEMHVAQSLGPAKAPTGIVMPTFLPETG